VRCTKPTQSETPAKPLRRSCPRIAHIHQKSIGPAPSRRWSKAKSGEGQVALLSGEAGIGKSRLTTALLERLATEPHTRLRYFCSPQRADSALYPIIGQMERAAGLARDDKPQTKLDKLDAMLAQSSTSARDAALFAEMLSGPERRTLSRARTNTATAQAKNTRSTRSTSCGLIAPKSVADDFRGCTLD
jgi:predicted ATPase